MDQRDCCHGPRNVHVSGWDHVPGTRAETLHAHWRMVGKVCKGVEGGDMERFAILIWIQVRHVKKRIKLALGSIATSWVFPSIPFSCMSLTNQDFFLISMTAFPIQLIVKIVGGAKKLCLIFVYNN